MGSKAPKQQKMPDPKELIELQALYNRVNIDTPFGSQTYQGDPGGTTTLKTDIGPLGEQLVQRGMNLGMTNAARQQIDPRMNELAGALMGNVGKRFGMDLSGPMQLAPPAAMPGNTAAKPPPQTPPPPTGFPTAPPPSFSPPPGSGPGLNRPQNPGSRLQELMQSGIQP